MNDSWRRLRSRILTPNVSETLLAVRGFHVKDAAAQELLETVGSTFLAGFAAATRVRSVGDIDRELAPIPTRYRGFAYEGAAMGFGVLDGLPGGGSRRLEQFVSGPGAPHVYMAYVGMGWALARLPRFRWPKLRAHDILLRWLVLDGWGFHQAYFRTREYVDGQFRDPTLRWPGPHSPYAQRAVDQGIGRALWFVCGTDPDRAVTAIEAFAPSRRGDLYSGLGLAVTYAGGTDEEGLTRLCDRAGQHLPQVAQGSAFAAEARLHAGLLVPHVELATEVLCGRTARQAANICADQLPVEAIDPASDAADPTPGYEQWRQRIAAVFTSPVRG